MEKTYVYTLASSIVTALVTLLIAKLLGKKKEDIELALNYQKFYKDLITDLEGKIERLSNKVEILIDKDNEKSLTIEGQRANLLKWENNCSRLEQIIKQKDKQISKLFQEIEAHEKK